MAYSTRSRRSAPRKHLWNWGITLGSVAFCLLILPTRLPGMELLGVSPNWLLIWVVAWSVSRTVFESAIAGLVLGLLQDSLTASYPTHALGLMITGILTARLQQRHYLQGDIISIALIVFGMAIVAETAMALQFTVQSLFLPNSLYASLSQIWVYHQKVALSSAILSSLWAPALYYPLKHWWERYRPSNKP
ncbi:rod shape-determining protein MreD [Romeria aff. gracilis LEGE 07310]|uniref:Rod shape-determining protein MreD n=1 Tax=Vasconcelosia minhoensis LEGE 07310 TaxID=915328 RepID=A0A8J7ARZ4_9CYAN|nr:rod shape-determining protein MreD [Romeria gracilis]MBE9079299.1 rod shape-determining protein MreD [Romeria aff. gracilis LEGE 07310]